VDAGERLRAWWTAQGVEVRTQPVLQAEVAALEQRYGIRLPEDFRRYLLTGGPTEEGWDGECDTNWWSVRRIRNIPDEYDSPVNDPRIAAAADKYLFFADHMIWAWAWAICCTDDADRGRVAIIGGSPDRIVADSFGEFVDRYVKKDWKSLL
jgi:hypothetical protein